MTVSSIGSTSACARSSYQSGLQQRRSDFNQLSQALQSGDLSGAQKAYSSLTQNSSSQTAPSNQNSPLAQDFAALGKSLQSGDLSGAQQAFSKLQQDAASSTSSAGQPQAGGTNRGHHRHHRVDSDSDASSSSTSTATTGNTQNDGTTTGTIINVTG